MHRSESHSPIFGRSIIPDKPHNRKPTHYSSAKTSWLPIVLLLLYCPGKFGEYPRCGGLSAAFFISTATISSVRERHIRSIPRLQRHESPDRREICFMPEAGLALPATVDSSRHAVLPSRRRGLSAAPRALGAVKPSAICGFQANVLRINTSEQTPCFIGF